MTRYCTAIVKKNPHSSKARHHSFHPCIRPSHARKFWRQQKQPKRENVFKTLPNLLETLTSKRRETQSGFPRNMEGLCELKTNMYM